MWDCDWLRNSLLNAFHTQKRIQLDVLFDALLHHRVKEYAMAYANSNDQEILGGRAADVAHAFCVNVFGTNFETETNDGAMAPMIFTTLFNSAIAALMQGLQNVNQQLAPALATRSSKL